jgi:hypothetical protein
MGGIPGSRNSARRWQGLESSTKPPATVRISRRSFKAKYNHKTGPRGGIEIVEVLDGRGSPEGKTVTSIKNLHEAEDFYNRSPLIFQEFVS